MSIETVKTTSESTDPNVQSYLDKKLGAIVRPKGQDGISGWVFDIPAGETVELSSDITDHYTESGSFLDDHVVHKPIRITLLGFVGNLKYEVPKSGSVAGNLSALTSKLSTVSAYLGPFTPQAVQKMSVATNTATQITSQIDAMKKRASNLEKMYKGISAGNNPQEEAYNSIKALWISKQIVTVETPWEYFPSMLIETITVKQDDESNDITDFSITLKEARFANTKKVTFDNNLFPPPQQMQAAETNDIGKAQSKEELVSALDTVFYGGQ